MDRYSSMMISNVAGEYLEAAKIMGSHKSDKFKPTYFLVCRSLELSLKGSCVVQAIALLSSSKFDTTWTYASKERLWSDWTAMSASQRMIDH